MAYGKLTLNPGTDGKEIAIDTINGEDFQRIKQVYGGEGVATEAQQPLTDAQLTAQGLAKETTLELIRLLLAGTLTVNVGLTDTQLRATPVPISGTVTSNTGLTQPLTDTQLRASAVPTKEIRSSTGGDSTASISTSATVLAANSSRLGATIYNESGGACRIKLGATASATSYTMIIAINGYYEVPYGYTGIITGIAVSGTAVLRITELT